MINFKKLLAGTLSAAMVLGTMALPVFADDAVTTGTTGSVTVSGVKIAEGKTYGTIQEAYNEIKAALEAKAGLKEEALNEEDFNAFFTEGGKITWTISGEQKVTDSRMFSFGRAANRFGDGRHITEINIVGDENAVLDLSDVNGTFALPYNWWNVADSANTALKCKNITFNGIKSMPSATYQCVLYSTTYEFDGCTFNGNLYSYQNFDVDMTIKNSTFKAPDNETTYAFMSQGLGGTITLDNNKIYGYTRGINLQRETADFIVTNNTIESSVSEPDRGAVQITDGKSFVVTGNTIDVNGGNAFWFHSAAKNSNATYTISENNIKAPYLANDDTTFGVNDKITCIGNIYNDTDILNCMEKEAAEATKSTVETMMPVAQIGDKYYTTLKDAMQAACDLYGDDYDKTTGISTRTEPVTIDLVSDIENQEGFYVRGGEKLNTYGSHYAHNIDITLDGHGYKIDTGVYGCENPDVKASPKIGFASLNGKFTVKDVVVPNDLVFDLSKTYDDVLSECSQREGGQACSLTIEGCTFYGSNVAYCGAVDYVTYKNNKFLLTENANNGPDSYPLWYKFNNHIKSFTFEGNTVKSQRALNLARFAENSEIVVNNNNFAIANTENPAKSAAIMLAENHTASSPFTGNVTFSGNTVDAHSAVLVYAPSEYNTNFTFAPENNTLVNNTKLVGFNEWSGSYSDENAKKAAEALVNKIASTNAVSVKFNPTADKTVYDIVLSGEGKNINRLTSADLKFKLETKDAITYEIKKAGDMDVAPKPDNYNRYLFNFDGVNKADATVTEIVIGQVEFTGYGKFTFGVDGNAKTNIVNATKTVDNIVTSYVVNGGTTTSEGTLDLGDGITNGEIKQETANLTVNVSFPNAVVNQVAAYQDMKVTVSGNGANEVVKLGKGVDGVTFANDNDTYTVEFTDKLVKGNTYTVTVSGAGYRTARYTVSMTGDKTLNFWNNVKTVPAYVEERVGNPTNTNFLAGDIVKDGQINIYDLSAVVSYFGTDGLSVSNHPEYAKYDLNRDGVIDSKDVAYVLVSWGK